MESLLEMRRDQVILREWDLSCGAAALATLMTYQLGDQVGEREVAINLIQREDYIENPELVRRQLGFSLLDLKNFVDERSFLGLGFGDMDLEDLVEMAPVIVPVRVRGYNHFVIFRGMYKGRVLLADPAWGNRTMTVEDFEDSSWLVYPDLGHVGFVVANADGSLPPNRMAPEPDDFVMLR